MKWYYSINNEQRGPVDQAGFEQLVQQGIVTSTTLVWHEGMTEWQPYASTNPNPATSIPPMATVCTRCGGTFPEGDLLMLSGRLVCASCKPVVLQQMREGVSPDSDAEKIRKEHINHESSIKSVGFLYILGAVLMLISSVTIMIVGAASEAISATIGVIYFFLGAAAMAAGIGLRKLKPWARIVSIVLSTIGLIGFPFGTIINGYILYLMVCKKGQMVFSPEYKNIIAVTPHVKCRTSIVAWIFLAVLILLLLGIALAAFFAARSH